MTKARVPDVLRINGDIADLMISPVVSADDSDTREDLVELFDKYHFRMIPVVDAKDHLLGSIHHEDIMKGE